MTQPRRGFLQRVFGSKADAPDDSKMFLQNGLANVDAEFPVTIEEVTAEWLSQALITAGVISVPNKVSGIQATPFAVSGGFYSELYKVSLEYLQPAPDAPDSVILKMGVQNDGHHDIATTLEFYDREVRYYQLLGHDAPVGIPRVYAAGVRDDGKAVLIVMEDISAQRDLDQLQGMQEQDAFLCVEELAKFHAHYWGTDFSELQTIFWPYDNPVHQAAFPEFIQAGWPVVKRVHEDWLPKEFVTFAETFDRTVGELITAMDGRDTLVHGDWRATNIKVPDSGGVSVLDFQLTGLGEPAYDLGYFISQSVANDVRRKAEPLLIEHYLKTLMAHGGKPDMASFHRKYGQAVLLCAIVPIADHAAWDEHSDKLKIMTQTMLERSISTILDGGHLALAPTP